MKIKYLGTAAFEGIPAMFCECRICTNARKHGGKDIRTRPQAVIDDKLLIDYPPDTYMHTLHGNLNMLSIEALILTHSHEDHLCPAELEMNCPPFALRDSYRIFPIYGNGCSLELIKNTFGEDLTTRNLSLTQIRAFEPFETADYRIIPLKALHSSFHMRVEDPLFFIIEKDGKRIMYAHDTGKFPEETMKYINGLHLDAVSLDCTQGKARDGHNHMGFEDVLEMLEALESNGNVDQKTIKIIHHFSHGGDITHDEYVELGKPYGIIPAYDGLELEI